MTSHIAQFRLGAAGNFPIITVLFKEACLKFGIPGQEIIKGVPIPLSLPTKNATDDVGEFIYAHEVQRDEKGSPVLQIDGITPKFYSFLSDNGERAFLQDIAYYRTQLVLREQHTAALMVLLLEFLSPESKNALDVDPLYTVAKNTPDTFAVWQMVIKVHQFGSSRTKFQFLVDFFACRQDGRAFDAFVVDLNRKNTLVLGAFDSSTHPGYISLDLLKKLVFMQGIDKVFYVKVLDKLLDDQVNATLRKLLRCAMRMC